MENKPKYRPDQKLKLMDQVRQVLQYHHYSPRTQRTYCDWIVRYVKFHGAKKHPRHMGKTEVEAFLTHLAVNRNVAAATQNQAFNAILFLYKMVLDIPIEDKISAVRAQKRRRLPVVMSQNEVNQVI